MSRPKLSIALVLPLLLTVAHSRSTAGGGAPQDPAGGLPYNLAFDMREFFWNAFPTVTSDGNRVAYDVRQPPAEGNFSARYQPNGTPSSSVGSKVFITDRAAGRTIQVCPGGNCWRPAWSPD